MEGVHARRLWRCECGLSGWTSYDEDGLERLRHSVRREPLARRVVLEEEVAVQVVGAGSEGGEAALLEQGADQRLHGGRPGGLVSGARLHPVGRHVDALHAVAERAALGAEGEDGLRRVAGPGVPEELGGANLPALGVEEDAGVHGCQAHGGGVVVGPSAEHPRAAVALRRSPSDAARGAFDEGNAVVLGVVGELAERGRTARQRRHVVHAVAVVEGRRPPDAATHTHTTYTTHTTQPTTADRRHSGAQQQPRPQEAREVREAEEPREPRERGVAQRSGGDDRPPQPRPRPRPNNAATTTTRTRTMGRRRRRRTLRVTDRALLLFGMPHPLRTGAAIAAASHRRPRLPHPLALFLSLSLSSAACGSCGYGRGAAHSTRCSRSAWDH